MEQVAHSFVSWACYTLKPLDTGLFRFYARSHPLSPRRAIYLTFPQAIYLSVHCLSAVDALLLRHRDCSGRIGLGCLYIIRMQKATCDWRSLLRTVNSGNTVVTSIRPIPETAELNYSCCPQFAPPFCRNTLMFFVPVGDGCLAKAWGEEQSRFIQWTWNFTIAGLKAYWFSCNF